MNLHDAGLAKLAAGPAFEVTLRLSVRDALILWDAAAEIAAAAPGMTLDDVIDTIGPRENPSLGECIAVLTAPLPIEGCAPDSFEVREISAPSATIPGRPRLRAAAR